METLLIVAIAVGIAWFFLSGTYSTKVKDPADMRGAELEDVFIDLKKKILVTSVDEQEHLYKVLYARLKRVIGRIIDRHKHFILDVEAQFGNVHSLFVPRTHYDMNGMRYTEHAVPSDLNMSVIQSEVLLYLCFFLWHGGHVKAVGVIESNPKLMLKFLSHLIDERSFPPALFFRGLVLKYGVTVYEQGSYKDARRFLQLAYEHGVGAAAIELEQINKYAQLEGIKSVHSWHGG